jgi:hypothetical protein
MKIENKKKEMAGKMRGDKSLPERLKKADLSWEAKRHGKNVIAQNDTTIRTRLKDK